MASTPRPRVRNRAPAPAARALAGALALLSIGAAVAGDPPPPVAPVEHAPQLAPGEWRWTPDLAPSGPVVIVVSLPEQRLHAYRNGVRIGLSTISTGTAGHPTPTGVFSILERRTEHYSNLYDAAPMPFMQRLTWDGIALHAGTVPGHPASHGCVRLPYAFAERLFGITARGMTVVIADDGSSAPEVVRPGFFAPVDARTGTPWPPATPDGPGFWAPERAPDGPVTVLVDTAAGQLRVQRQAIEIGRATLRATRPLPPGQHLFVKLAATHADGVDASGGARWLHLPLAGLAPDAGALDMAGLQGLQLAPDFAAALEALLRPGDTVLLTDTPLAAEQPAGGAILSSEPQPPSPTD